MQACLVRTYYKYTTYRAGHRKHSLPINNKGNPASFSYTEKGTRSGGKPTIVFVHGVASYKEGWMSIVKNIPADHHCITLDLPAHGQTVGLNEEVYSIDKFVEKLKLFFDEMGLTEPMCIIGASMGSAIVCMFAVKYPDYVSMIILLAPVADRESETELVHQLRNGVYNGLLPETPQQLRQIINDLTVKRPYVPKPMLNGILHIKLQLLEEHKKVIAQLFEHDYPNLEREYAKLRHITCPVLVVWGRQDKVFSCNGIEFFRKLIPNLEYKILENCGHDMDVDQPEETAEQILKFYNGHWNAQINQRIRIDQETQTNQNYFYYCKYPTNSLSPDDINGIALSGETVNYF